MRRVSLLLTAILLLRVHASYAQRQVRFVFVSDLHYGLMREFRGEEATSAEVCRAMAGAVRALPEATLPADNGVGAGERVGALDFVACGGDIANRMEAGVQTSAASWTQFAAEWLSPGMPETLLLPGNHDLSNAIGHPQLLSACDATCAAEIYNRAMHPAVPRTAATFDFTTDKVHYIVEREGIRLVFAGMWLDTPTRTWLGKELCEPADSLPCLLFTHLEPEAEARRFTNPHGDHSINRTDGFENLLCDTCSVGCKGRPLREYRAVESFLAAHPRVKAWFHGHTNYNEFYCWHGADGTISLPVFRVDSPMKGEMSADDEKLLSFQVVAIDPAGRRMTVREYFWNTAGSPWGASMTVGW